MEQAITTKQIQYIKVLMRNKGVIDLSGEFAHSFSAGRTTHVSELTVKEGIELIKGLTANDQSAERKQDEERMRRKIISHAYEMGWVITDISTGVSKLQADMESINAWCLKYGYLHKPLNEYTFEELPKLVSQFGRLHKQFLKELK